MVHRDRGPQRGVEPGDAGAAGGQDRVGAPAAPVEIEGGPQQPQRDQHAQSHPHLGGDPSAAGGQHEQQSDAKGGGDAAGPGQGARGECLLRQLRPVDGLALRSRRDRRPRRGGRRRHASRRHGSGRGRQAARDDVRARLRRRRRCGTRRLQRLDRLLELVDALRQAADLGRQRNDLCTGDVVVSAHGIPSVVSAVWRHEINRAGGCMPVVRHAQSMRAGRAARRRGDPLTWVDARIPSRVT